MRNGGMPLSNSFARSLVMGTPTTPPLFRFGVVSDVQHADIPDGKSFGGVPRYYRNALVSLGRAVEGFKAANVSFALHLGDVRSGVVRNGCGWQLHVAFNFSWGSPHTDC